jgi:hypothetical protein
VTIEASLRKRAKQLHLTACLLLLSAVVILLGTYSSLPYFTGLALKSIREAMLASISPTSSLEQMVFSFAIGAVILAFAAIIYSCTLLGRGAYVAIELATQASGLADALCIAGDNLVQLEKYVALLVPATKHFSPAELVSGKDVETLIELLKKLK